MKNHILISMLFLMASLSALAQPINRPTYAALLKSAEEELEKKQFLNAYEKYSEAYEESKDPDLIILMADLAFKLRDYKNSEKWYQRALKKSKKNKNAEKWEDKRFELARSLKMNEKYDEAIEEFDKYIAGAIDPVRKELAESEKIGCEFARVAKEDETVSVTNAGKEVNTKISEYSAFLTNDNKEMYYASLNSDEVIVVGKDSSDDYQSKIYKSIRGEKGWEKPTPLDEAINRPGFFNANVTLSPDGKRMFFCREQIEGDVLVESKIWMSEGNGGSWGAANELAGVNGNFIAKSPSVGELFGKEVLFFVSDMEGGSGGYDIYYATYKGAGQYGDPVNLGPQINTVGNEDTPFYRDGILYFSSEGHPGIGGYDVFMSTWNGTRWSKPQNMGKPYNSSVDDLYFMLDKEGYHGFVVSNRPAEGARSLHSKTCCNDIYNVSLKKIEATVTALAYDSETKEPLNGVTFELIQLGDTPKTVDSKTNGSSNNYDTPLELDRTYIIVASAENYENDTFAVNTVGLFDSKNFPAKLNLKPGRITKKIVRNEPFVLENILYDFDDDKITLPAEGDLQVIYDLMNKYPDMVIELSSHTDARGNDEYNRNLSQRRAESARRWLTNKGIARTRIQAKGYGETQPKTVDAKTAKKFAWLKEGQVLTEEYINSLLPDSVRFEAAHQLNRRTEFKILEGPTSITIEEEQLIQIGNRKVDGSAPPKTEPNKDEKKPAPNNNRKPNQRNKKGKGNDSPGGDSIPGFIQLEKAMMKDSAKIHPLSSLYGKKDLKGLPIMQFDERIYDMGKVKKGEIKEHTFNYTNVGDVALDIDLISVCECTTYEFAPSVVQPGGKGWIKVLFDSNKKDESDTSDVDIYLKNIDPEIDAPIFERVQFKYELVQ
ncbi:MAG: OmpA family protein [Lewinellaceae bacterium]|nr:OmpA family protein [Saprospiraceae bacterium]MCB9337692.1 OmpA family protein [Lewinellaceae bacterium]